MTPWDELSPEQQVDRAAAEFPDHIEEALASGSVDARGGYNAWGYVDDFVGLFLGDDSFQRTRVPDDEA